jgi:hypothetical protein
VLGLLLVVCLLLTALGLLVLVFLLLCLLLTSFDGGGRTSSRTSFDKLREDKLRLREDKLRQASRG